MYVAGGAGGAGGEWIWRCMVRGGGGYDGAWCMELYVEEVHGGACNMVLAVVVAAVVVVHGCGGGGGGIGVRDGGSGGAVDPPIRADT